jgi:hypothetical protein
VTPVDAATWAELETALNGAVLRVYEVDGDRVRSVPSGENALRFPWAVGSRGTEAFILDSGHSRVLAVPLATLPSKPAEPAPLPRPVG